MKHVIDIEELLRTKSWAELDQEERKVALDEVSSMEEYEELHHTYLMLADDSMDEAPITPDPRIKEELMGSFQTESPERFVWLNAFWAWLYPQDKPVFQRPALQIAAVLLIGVVIVTVWMSADQAVNQQVAQEDSPKPEEEVVEPRREIEGVEDTKEEEIIESEDELSQTEARAQEQDMASGEKGAAVAEEPSIDLDTEAEDDLTIVDELVVSDYSVESAESANLQPKADQNSSAPAEGYSMDDSYNELEMADEETEDLRTRTTSREAKLSETIATGAVASGGMARENEKGLNASRSMAEDGELIDLLYTAY